MASTRLLKPCLSTAAELCLFSTKPKTPSLPFLLPPKPISLSLSLSLFLKKRNLSFTPFVSQASDWAQQEEKDDEEEEEGQSTEASLSEWEGDGESNAEVGSGVFAQEETYPEEAKLFVGNLPYDIDSEGLAGLFDKAGVVEIADVIFSRETGQSRGFGFVTMSTVEEADKAVEMFNRYDINGRLLTVNKAAPRGARVERAPREFEPSFRVYVGNLPWQIDDSRLEQVFSEHGKVVSARVVYDRETGRSRGFGFVTMASQNELDDAIAALDGQSLDGRAIRVNVAEERARRSF